MEKRISSACLHEKFVRHGQRPTLVGLQRNFLCQHDVACDEISFGRKAQTNTRTAGAVELVDVHRGAVANPVSLSAVAAGDLKIAFRVILRELLRREPFLQQPEAACFPFPVSVAKAWDKSRGRVNAIMLPPQTVAQNSRPTPAFRQKSSETLLRVAQ